MIFGYWLQATTDEDGKVTRAFSAFTDGNELYGEIATTGGDVVEGTATYTGPATGMYMKKSLTPEGQPTRPFSSGQFTADAMLNANFGGGEIGAQSQVQHHRCYLELHGWQRNVINEHWAVSLDRLDG